MLCIVFVCSAEDCFIGLQSAKKMLQQNSVFHGSTAVTTTTPAHQPQVQAVGGGVTLTTAGPAAETVGGVYGTAVVAPGVGVGTATKMAIPKQVQ